MEPFSRVRELLDEGFADGAFPSGALSIGMGADVLATHTWGPATPNTLYDIASLSKIVSATMIAFRFLEEGRLRLYDTLERFFPAPPDKKDITILHLMTHTSGIPAHYYLSEEAESPADAARAILSHPL